MMVYHAARDVCKTRHCLEPHVESWWQQEKPHTGLSQGLRLSVLLAGAEVHALHAVHVNLDRFLCVGFDFFGLRKAQHTSLHLPSVEQGALREISLCATLEGCGQMEAPAQDCEDLFHMRCEDERVHVHEDVVIERRNSQSAHAHFFRPGVLDAGERASLQAHCHEGFELFGALRAHRVDLGLLADEGDFAKRLVFGFLRAATEVGAPKGLDGLPGLGAPPSVAEANVQETRTAEVPTIQATFGISQCRQIRFLDQVFHVFGRFVAVTVHHAARIVSENERLAPQAEGRGKQLAGLPKTEAPECQQRNEEAVASATFMHLSCALRRRRHSTSHNYGKSNQFELS
mmetsp:Transcript_127814/g.409310  ORF Transcript_127814/g.409310 Transcript_127814/m.409310 type:complete len:344 (+) Transcript_127814:970-2001(+)